MKQPISLTNIKVAAKLKNDKVGRMEAADRTGIALESLGKANDPDRMEQ